jgi:two-component system chemotaxis response regulator CheY
VVLGHDYEVIESCNGREALNKIKSGFTPDMIFCDVNMPEMGGLEFAASIQHHNIPVIMLTSDSDTKKKEQGKSIGIKGWIQKPFSPESILEAAKKVLG